MIQQQINLPELLKLGDLVKIHSKVLTLLEMVDAIDGDITYYDGKKFWGRKLFYIQDVVAIQETYILWFSESRLGNLRSCEEKLPVIKRIENIADTIWSCPVYHGGAYEYKIWSVVIIFAHR